jgi:hypothetical protein
MRQSDYRRERLDPNLPVVKRLIRWKTGSNYAPVVGSVKLKSKDGGSCPNFAVEFGISRQVQSDTRLRT